MKKKSFGLAAFLLLLFLPIQAVLNESDFAKTLQVLRDELAQLLTEQQATVANLRRFDDMQHERLLSLISKSNETALILYSQSENYIFNVTYACNEATTQYSDFMKSKRPYENIIAQLDTRIARYDRLIEALEALPPRAMPPAPPADDKAKGSRPATSDAEPPLLPDSVDLDEMQRLREADQAVMELSQSVSQSARSSFMLTQDQQTLRDSCVAMARTIRQESADICTDFRADYEQYEALSEKLKVLNDYARDKYSQLQKDIFVNGETSFVQMLAQPAYYVFQAVHDVKEKYVLTGGETAKSSWKGPVVLFFTFFAIFYLIVAVLLSNVIFWLVSRKHKNSERFRLQKNYLVTAGSMLLFSAVMFVMQYFISDNFFQMASSLLVEFSLLMTVIVASLLFRYEPHILSNGLRIYLPVMVMGFVVIFCRIIFVPNTLVSLVYPPLLTVMAVWQFFSTTRYNKNVPRSDVFYSWISFATITVSCVCSWTGYTLMAVQIFTWWMMQLTAILGITCAFDAMEYYEEGHLRNVFAKAYPDNKLRQNEAFNIYKKRNGELFEKTWLADFINMTAIPVIAILSFPLCIYWASGIFDLTDTVMSIYRSNLLQGDLNAELYDGLTVVPSNLVLVAALFFVFKFINYILRAVYKRIIDSSNDANKQANITLANNVISIVSWGIFFIMALVMLNVPSSGISIVTAGLATGIGFALKDVLNNFFYGLSLMAGRVRVGEMIECDGVRGKVESITYQSTQILTIDGSIIAFLNSNLFAKSFKNLTRNHDYELVKVPIGVAYGSNIAQVRDLLRERISNLISRDSHGNYNIDPKRGVSVVFSSFGDSSLDLDVVLWMRIETKLKTCSDVNEVIYNVLNENNIEIPFPQRDLHVVSNK